MAQRVHLAEQLEGAPRAPERTAHHLFQHARRRAARDLFDVLLHRRQRGLLEVERALCRESDGTQDAHRIPRASARGLPMVRTSRALRSALPPT